MILVALAAAASGAALAANGQGVTIGIPRDSGTYSRPVDTEARREHKRAVDAEIARLGGEHRRAEAERLVALREQADAARKAGRPIAGATFASPTPTAVATARLPSSVAPKRCSFPAYTTSDSWGGITVPEARARLLAAQSKRCAASSGGTQPGTMIGQPRCKAPVAMKFKTATRYTNASCSANYACPAYEANCQASGGKAGKAIAQ